MTWASDLQRQWQGLHCRHGESQHPWSNSASKHCCISKQNLAKLVGWLACLLWEQYEDCFPHQSSTDYLPVFLQAFDMWTNAGCDTVSGSNIILMAYSFSARLEHNGIGKSREWHVNTKSSRLTKHPDPMVRVLFSSCTCNTQHQNDFFLLRSAETSSQSALLICACHRDNSLLQKDRVVLAASEAQCQM